MKSWLIPCNPNVYDTEASLAEYGHVIWHQDCNMSVGDVAYMYITAPVKAIRCKCIVDAVNMPADPGDDDGYEIDREFCGQTFKRHMDLKLVETYSGYGLDYCLLRMNGLSGPIRSQRSAPDGLASFIEKQFLGNSSSETEPEE